MRTITLLLMTALAWAGTNRTAVSQVPEDEDWPPGPPEFGGPPPGGFDGPGRPGSFGPPPGGVQEERKLVQQFDQNGDKRLDRQERQAARAFLAKEQSPRPGGRRPGPPGRRRGAEEPPTPGPKLSPTDVASFPNAPLYDLAVLRTLFLEFENADWEKELADFHRTDVEVPARLTVDGKVYDDVGVHFRGASSYFMVPEGRKRSLNLALDFVHEDQRLYGYRTLNLLNSHEDPTFLRTVLYYDIARQWIPAPKANYVRLVINGESWGIYVNAQQFNKDSVQEWFGTTQGARWKVPGSPAGDGGLAYLGEDLAPYKRRYEIKSKDNPKSWASLVELCRVLNQTPPDNLEEALQPRLDLDGVLKFLALENVFINNDGYWTRASDYNIYRDLQGRFHIIPHDANETFSAAGGPVGPVGPVGRGGFRRGNGFELDPLAGVNDSRKPLLSKLLAVPALKARYLEHVQTLAEQWLDWNKIGPLAAQWQALIADDLEKDTRKLDTYLAFRSGVTDDAQDQGGRGPGRAVSLKTFVEKRRAYLLSHLEVKRAGAARVARAAGPARPQAP